MEPTKAIKLAVALVGALIRWRLRRRGKRQPPGKHEPHRHAR